MIELQTTASRLRTSVLESPPAALPPIGMMKTVGSPTVPDYLHNMADYAADIVEQCELTPQGHVLDIGSGCGRLATAFQRFLADDAAYLGFDVWQEGVQWCREHLTAARPNFRFETVQAANNYYYEDFSEAVNQFDLSFVPPQAFDCVFALSVFTHLKLRDARQYFRLVAESLKPTGYAYLTFFVIDEHVHRFIRETGQHTALAPAGDGMWYAYERQWFFSGYEDARVLKEIDDAGLEVVKRSPGSWAHKPGARVYQDWFLLRRKSS